MTPDISMRREEDVVIVTPVGELDAITSPPLADVLDEVLFPDPPRGVVVDLAKVAFCDSRCIGVLVSAYRRARDIGVGLVVAEPQQQVNRLFVIAGIDQVMPITASVGSAVGSLTE